MTASFDIHAFLQQFLYDAKNPLLFNNGFFVYLFGIFLLLYYLLRNHYWARTWLFCLFSLYFFYKASGFFVVFVIISAVVDFILSNLIYQQRRRGMRKLLLWISIVFNLSMLFYFKYTNFLVETMNNLFSSHVNPLNILLPVGISFYTFENISYTIDVYRKEFVPVKRFREYLLFLSFFPKLVMGPIVRAREFIPQISKPYYVSNEYFAEGFFLIISGLFKKLIISDYITLNYVDYIFDAPSKYTGLECLFAVYGYAIVIYCDFSGYSNIAIGIARWLGFYISPNFNLPYKSKDVTEFWRRWHISLSTWLRDYLYIPLGGNRKGKTRTYIHLMITMLLGGLWHGANWTFIAWGALHGGALAAHKLWSEYTRIIFQKIRATRLYQFLAMLITFHFVCFCWIFFRARNFTIAGNMISQIKNHFGLDVWGAFWGNYYSVILMMLLGYFFHALPESSSAKAVFRLQKVKVGWYLCIFLLFLLIYGNLKSSEQVLPIYLKF